MDLYNESRCRGESQDTVIVKDRQYKGAERVGSGYTNGNDLSNILERMAKESIQLGIEQDLVKKIGQNNGLTSDRDEPIYQHQTSIRDTEQTSGSIGSLPESVDQLATRRANEHQNVASVKIDCKSLNDSKTVMQFFECNRQPFVDNIQTFDRRLKINIEEKRPSGAIDCPCLNPTALDETDFEQLIFPFLAIREKVEADGRSPLTSVDESLMHFTTVGRGKPNLRIHPRVFKHSPEEADLSDSPTTKQYNDRLQFLLNRKISLCDSDNNAQNKLAYLKEILNLGIALNSNMNQTNMNTVYHSRIGGVNEGQFADEAQTKKLFFVENEESSDSDILLDSHDPSFRFIEKNENFYILKQALDGYQSEFKSENYPVRWNDLKTLNMCFEPANGNIKSKKHESRIIEPGGQYFEDLNPFVVYTNNDVSAVETPLLKPRRDDHSFDYMYAKKIDYEELSCFESKTHQAFQGDVTPQSISNKGGYSNIKERHPFTESNRSDVSDNRCIDTEPLNEPAQDNSYLIFLRKPPTMQFIQQQDSNLIEKTPMPLDLDVNENNWDSAVSNSLQNIINNNDGEMLGILEADGMFKTTPRIEYIDYNEPTEIELTDQGAPDANSESNISVSDRGSFDSPVYRQRTGSENNQGTVCNTGLLDLSAKLEPQYFSFNDSG